MSLTSPLESEPAEHRRATSTRDRILDAASDLFYANGIGATSADRIIEQVGITKVTFYRHFRTKADLVVAYLEQQAAGEEQAFAGVRDGGDALAAVRTIALGIGAASCRPGFRGCPFINAAAEFPDAQHPVRGVVDAHRGWMLGLFVGIAADAGTKDPDAVGGQLMMLRDGAMVSGYLSDPDAVAEGLRRGFVAVLAAGRDAAAS